MGKKNNSTVVENGAVYQVSNPGTRRVLSRIAGVVLALEGAVLALAAPVAGVVLVAIGVALVAWLPKRIQPKKKFLSFSGQPCAGNHTFGKWNAKVHDGQAQVDRFEKAAHQPMAIRTYNAETGFAEIQGSGSDSYLTGLDECTCPDFDKRGRPCKHIYFLAIQMGYTSDDFYNS